MSLAQLPLRPSSLSTLIRRGFDTTNDVKDSAQVSIANFASELGTSLETANGIYKEVLQCCEMLHPSDAKKNETTNEQSTVSGNNFTNKDDDADNNDNDNDDGLVVSCDPSNACSIEEIKRTAASILLSNSNNKKNTNGTTNSSNNLRPIVSFCKGIDTLLGGGFCPCEVTEIVGVPGVGKTQLAMQLCVDASLPREFGGVAGESVYIDSEGSFAPERMLAMAEALVSHVHASARRRRERQAISLQHQPKFVAVPQHFTSENILKGVHVFRVHDEASQKSTIYSLPDFLREKVGSIKLIVIDSIAFHYRGGSSSSNSNENNYMSRTRSLTSTASFLSDLASQHQLAVVVVNHMTTKIDANQHSESRLVPALGESWAHCTTTRLLLSHVHLPSNGAANSRNNQSLRTRRCTLVKSPHKPAASADFVVLEVGIRDPNSALVRESGLDNSCSTVRVRSVSGGSAEKRARVSF